MPRAGLSPDALVDIAMTALDETGDVTLANVAARARVATPSLYKHVTGLAQLRDLIALRIMDELNDRVTEASLGRSGPEAVAAAMRAWRAYVLEHPHRYAALPVQPLEEPALAEAGHRLMRTVASVLRGYNLSPDDVIHSTRALRVIVHGFASLEATGGFGLPQDRDESFGQLIDMYLGYVSAKQRD